MKQIIVITDFSPSSEKASQFAASIAAKTGASLTLLHVYQMPVSMTEVPVMMISADELRQGADAGLSKAAEALQQSFPSLDLHREARMGDVSAELNILCDELAADLVVSGKHGASGMERFFFGSTSMSVVRHAEVPVIVVPEGATVQEIRTIALAIDDERDALPSQKIKSLVADLGASLHVIHVQPQKTATPELTGLVSGLGVAATTIRDDEFLHGVQTFIDEKSVDMLMVLPHHHGFLERLTFRSHTEELLRKLPLPVACINS